MATFFRWLKPNGNGLEFKPDNIIVQKKYFYGSE